MRFASVTCGVGSTSPVETIRPLGYNMPHSHVGFSVFTVVLLRSVGGVGEAASCGSDGGRFSFGRIAVCGPFVAGAALADPDGVCGRPGVHCDAQGVMFSVEDVQLGRGGGSCEPTEVEDALG